MKTKENKQTLNVTGIVFDLSKPFAGQTFKVDAMTKAINEYKEKLEPASEVSHNTVDPTVGYADMDLINFSMNDIHTDDITHKVKDIYIKDDKVVANIEILNTPQGNVIQDLINAGTQLHASPSMLRDGDNLTIVSFDIYPDTLNSQNLPPLVKV